MARRQRTKPRRSWGLVWLLVLLAGLVAPGPAGAGFDLGGMEQAEGINATIGGDQDRPAAAGLSDGGFVAAWVDRHRGSPVEIRLATFDADGTSRGGDIIVAEADNSQQVAAAGLSNGNLVVIWDLWRDDTNRYDVAARIYDAVGSPLSEVFYIAESGDYDYLPAVAALEGGGFVVSWTRTPRDGSRSGAVYCRRYDSAGQAQGEEVLVSAEAEKLSRSAVAGLSQGAYVVAWDGVSWGVTGWDVHFQRYDAADQPQGGVVTPSADTLDIQWNPTVTKVGDDRFAVVWVNLDASKQATLRGRVYDLSGNPVAGETTLQGDTVYSQSRACAVETDEGFAVAFSGQPAGQPRRVYLRYFDRQGVTTSELLLPDTYQSDQQHPGLAALRRGLAVVWQAQGKDGSGWGVFGRRY